MGWILKEGKEGLVGEPASARISYKPAALAALAWGLYFLMEESDITALKMIGIFFLLGAWVWSAKALFHLVTVGIVGLPRKTQSLAQIAVAVIGAAIPLAYLILHLTDFGGSLLLRAFEPLIRSSFVWLPNGLFVYVVYAAATRFPSFLPVKRYLILATGVFLTTFIGGQGGFDTDEFDYSLSMARPDSRSIDEQTHMAASYLRLVILGYGTLLFADLRQYATRNAREPQ